MYKIKTPNPNYKGKTSGVDFIDGYGQTENEEIKNVLINDFGYSLCEDEKPKIVEDMQERPTKEGKKEKQSPKKEGE